MNVENLKPDEFIKRYGSQPWAEKIDDNTQSVLVGSRQDLETCLGDAGFVSPYMFAGSRGAEKVLARSAKYEEVAFNALGELTGDPLNITSQLSELSKENNLGEVIGSYLPNFVKRLGATLPMDGRTHARIYSLGDGKYAATMHTDPGMANYFGEGLRNGDLTEVFSGLGEAIKYHFEPTINEYKAMIGKWLTKRFKPESAPNPAEAYV